MKYAVAAVADQTWTYLCEDGSYTTKHPEAKLFDEEAAALAAKSEDGWVEEVPDEAEFRSREDTW